MLQKERLYSNKIVLIKIRRQPYYYAYSFRNSIVLCGKPLLFATKSRIVITSLRAIQIDQ